MSVLKQRKQPIGSFSAMMLDWTNEMSCSAIPSGLQKGNPIFVQAPYERVNNGLFGINLHLYVLKNDGKVIKEATNHVVRVRCGLKLRNLFLFL